MNKQTGICPGMHALCFLRSVWLWLSLSMTHCHILLHTSSLRRHSSASSSPFALTDTQTERHFTDTMKATHTMVWESMSHHIVFRVFQCLIRHSSWWLGFFICTLEADDTGATFTYTTGIVCLFVCLFWGEWLMYNDKLNKGANENNWVGRQ